MTIFEELQNAALPVISADESGAISMGAMTPEQENLYNDILLSYFNPTEWTKVQEVRANDTDFKTEYQNRIDRLTQIATVAKPDPFTQADIGAMFDALQDMARNQRAMMKRIK